jgi:hypothetical protein
MELSQLRDTIKAQPFKPFTLTLVDGRRYLVPHPEFLWVPPGKRYTMAFYNNEEAQALTMVDAVMISTIEFGDTRPTSPPNGTNGTAH